MVQFLDIEHNLREKDLEDIFNEKTEYSYDENKTIEKILILLVSKTYSSKKDYSNNLKLILKNQKKKIKKFPSKIELNIIYKKMYKSNIIDRNPNLEKYMKRKFCRSGSGELPVTVFTSPSKFDCPEDCSYCPDEKAEKLIFNEKIGKWQKKKIRIQPRSYLSTEPGCMRAAKDKFHPITQTYDRIHCLEIMGHEIDKIRFIVLGGTYCYYPMDYRIWFMTCLYYACNTYYRWSSRREMKSLTEEMRLNRISDVKIVGITVETRPDHTSLEDCAHFMSCGITTVQLGIQQLSNSILKGINRKCTVEQIKEGTKRILDCGLKLDTHYMFDLPGPGKLCLLSPKDDRNMIDLITEHEDFAVADQWKLYPCSTTPHTRILTWYNNMTAFFKNLKEKINAIKIQRVWRKYKSIKYDGPMGGDPIDLSKKKYLPYSEINGGSYLIDTLLYAKQKVHKDTRINRVIRDIPEISIVGGNKITNLRQHILEKIEKEGLKKCQCIRCREIQGGEFNIDALKLDIYVGIKAGSKDYFISFEDGDEKLYGLVRLRLLNDSSDTLPMLENSAIIRELHVYGATVRTNTKDKTKPQHSGLGKKLVKKCEEIAIKEGYKNLYITSGEGVINYYKNKLDYIEVEEEYCGIKYHYMMKNLDESKINKLWKYYRKYLLIIFSIIIIMISIIISFSINKR